LRLCEREIAVTTDAEDHAPAELTGAELVVRTLVDLGVGVVFGYPGGAVLPARRLDIACESGSGEVRRARIEDRR